jgi:protein SERAC1
MSNKHRLNNRDPRAGSIVTSTSGIVFLGTPHRGGNNTAWAKIVTGLATAVFKDNNARLIEALTRGSEILEHLQDSFSSIGGQFNTPSFFEERGFGVAGKVRIRAVNIYLYLANSALEDGR